MKWLLGPERWDSLLWNWKLFLGFSRNMLIPDGHQWHMKTIGTYGWCKNGTTENRRDRNHLIKVNIASNSMLVLFQPIDVQYSILCISLFVFSLDHQWTRLLLLTPWHYCSSFGWGSNAIGPWKTGTVLLGQTSPISSSFKRRVKFMCGDQSINEVLYNLMMML